MRDAEQTSITPTLKTPDGRADLAAGLRKIQAAVEAVNEEEARQRSMPLVAIFVIVLALLGLAGVLTLWPTAARVVSGLFF